MGLCDEERIQGLYHATSKMTELGKNTPMKHLTDQLWCALIGNEGNSAHWLIGSGSSKEVTALSSNLWGVAVEGHVSEAFKQESPWETKSKHDHIESMFEIPDLLRKGHYDGKVASQMRDTFELFKWTEQATYYLRRYNDELFKKQSEYNKLMADIQGACFDEFKEHDGFAKAYIVHQIMKGFIFCNLFPYQEENWDTLTKWIVDEHVYHNMDRCMEMDIKELGEIHMSLNKDKTMRNRAICLGKLLVRRLHKYEKDAFFSKLIPAEMFIKAKKMYDEHEERSMRSKDLSPMSIYGFDHYSEKDNSGVSKSKKKRKK